MQAALVTAFPVENLAADDKGAAPWSDTSAFRGKAYDDHFYVMFTLAGYRAPPARVTSLDRNAVFTLYLIDKRPPD